MTNEADDQVRADVIINDGESIYKVDLFRSSQEKPDAPDGGKYNFVTQELTEPSYWDITPKDPTEVEGILTPVWRSTGTFIIHGNEGYDPIGTWSDPTEVEYIMPEPAPNAED